MLLREPKIIREIARQAWYFFTVLEDANVNGQLTDILLGPFPQRVKVSEFV